MEKVNPRRPPSTVSDCLSAAHLPPAITRPVAGQMD